jgi:hypothetical protein
VKQNAGNIDALRMASLDFPPNDFAFRRCVMKLKNSLKGMVVTAFAATCMSPSHAGLPTWLVGEPAPQSAPTRTIRITPDTRWVNVTGGEVIRFVVGDQAFTVSFDVPLIDGDFDLAQIAPRGALRHPVRGYLARNPLYID